MEALIPATAIIRASVLFVRCEEPFLLWARCG
jgi:hypothetical protein